MAVEIGEEKTQETNDGKWQVVSEICNDGAQAVEVTVKQQPYSDGGPENKIGAAQFKDYTIPAGQCITVVFVVDKKPNRSYTDVYPKGKTDGPWLDGEVNKLKAVDALLTPYGNGKYMLNFLAPFPFRIFSAFGPGWQGEFVLESVSGVPPGWTVEVLSPLIGVPFQLLSNDRENPGVLRLTIPTSTPEGTVATLHLLQRVVGAPDEMLYRFDQHIKVVVDRTPPAVMFTDRIVDMGQRKITLMIQPHDSVSDISEVRGMYSVDSGATWNGRLFVLDPAELFNPTAIFQDTLGPFCAGQAVMTKFRVKDGVDNMRETVPEVTQF